MMSAGPMEGAGNLMALALELSAHYLLHSQEPYVTIYKIGFHDMLIG
jgi:hypothetical protein